MIGTTIYSIGALLFIAQNKLSPGGFTGIATLINYKTNIPTGLIILFLNIPVIILGYVKISSIFIINTSIVTVMLSIVMQFIEPIMPKIQIDILLSCIFGGVTMGIGIGIILISGATTGGVDIIAKLTIKKYRHITFGKVILCFDFFVILLTSIIYKNIESSLYSLIAMFVSTKTTDMLVYGSDKGKIAFIISSKPDEINLEISEKLKRSTSIINIIGGYTKTDKQMLICTVRPHEISYLYDIIEKKDKTAFVILSSADEILGEGFKKI